MSKVFKYTGFGIIIVLIAGYFFVNLYIDQIVKSGIEDMGTEMTQTQVTVDGISISPFSGKGTISGFKVKNPEGYSVENAIVIDNFHIALDLKSLLTDQIVVRNITIKSPSVYVEQKVQGNNLKTLMNNVEKGSSSESSSGVDLVIRHFLMENGRVTLHTEVGGERTAKMKFSKIELQDLGAGGGQKAAEQVVKTVSRKLTDAALKAALKGGANQLKKEAGDALKNIFN